MHTFKDVSYDFNNFVLSSLYYIPMILSHGKHWVVGCGQYRIVGGSLAHSSWETILTIGTASSMVKTMKQELKIDDIVPQCSNALVSFIFIELYNSSTCEDLTPPPLSTKSLKGIFQFKASLSLEPSTLVGSIQSSFFLLMRDGVAMTNIQ